MPTGILGTILFPFIKEIILGKRLVDPNSRPTRFGPEWFKDKVIDKLQSSRRLLIFLVLALAASLAMNYKTITNELSFALYRDKEHPEVKKPNKEPKEIPTVPKSIPSKSEKDDIYDQTMKELNELYKEL